MFTCSFLPPGNIAADVFLNALTFNSGQCVYCYSLYNTLTCFSFSFRERNKLQAVNYMFNSNCNILSCICWFCIKLFFIFSKSITRFNPAFLRHCFCILSQSFYQTGAFSQSTGRKQTEDWQREVRGHLLADEVAETSAPLLWIS